MIPLFFKMRGGIFHEDGFCLEAPVLSRESNAIFVSLNTEGKATQINQVPGCEGTQDPQIFINLRPWPEPDKALVALTLACANLRPAIDGDHEARKTLGNWWSYLISHCLPRDEKTTFAGLCNFHGKGRVHEALNKYGSLAILDNAEFVERVDEVFDRNA